jgi:hypothetical protein
MAAPTREDAQLMVQLARWGTELGLQDALPELFADRFDPDTADMLESAAVRTVLYYGESIGTLVKHDLLSRELVEDWIWVEGMWSKVGPAALRQREKAGEPRLFENFEALATRRP